MFSLGGATMDPWITPLYHQMWQGSDQLGKHDDEQHDQHLQENERDGATVDVACGHLRRGNAAEIKQGKPEGWCEERRLQVGPNNDPIPDQSFRSEEGLGNRCKKRDNNKGSLEKVDKKSQDKNCGHADDEKACRLTGKAEEQVGNQAVLVEATEGAYVAQCQDPANSSWTPGFGSYEASPAAAVSRGPYAGHRLKRPSRLWFWPVSDESCFLGSCLR